MPKNNFWAEQDIESSPEGCSCNTALLMPNARYELASLLHILTGYLVIENVTFSAHPNCLILNTTEVVRTEIVSSFSINHG